MLSVTFRFCISLQSIELDMGSLAVCQANNRFVTHSYRSLASVRSRRAGRQGNQQDSRQYSSPDLPAEHGMQDAVHHSRGNLPRSSALR